MEQQGVRSLNQRLKKLEQHVSLVTGETHNGAGSSDVSSVYLKTITKRKQEREATVLKNFEEQFYEEVHKKFDLSHSKSLFLQITRFTIEYVAENSVKIAQVIGFGLTGVYRFDLVVSLLKTLFTDISDELLGCVVQNTYDLLYRKNDDVKTIQILHEKLDEINFPRPEDKKKPLPPPRKSSFKRLFACKNSDGSK